MATTSVNHHPTTLEALKQDLEDHGRDLLLIYMLNRVANALEDLSLVVQAHTDINVADL